MQLPADLPPLPRSQRDDGGHRQMDKMFKRSGFKFLGQSVLLLLIGLILTGATIGGMAPWNYFGLVGMGIGVTAQLLIVAVGVFGIIAALNKEYDYARYFLGGCTAVGLVQALVIVAFLILKMQGLFAVHICSEMSPSLTITETPTPTPIRLVPAILPPTPVPPPPSAPLPPPPAVPIPSLTKTRSASAVVAAPPLSKTKTKKTKTKSKSKTKTRTPTLTPKVTRTFTTSPSPTPTPPHIAAPGLISNGDDDKAVKCEPLWFKSKQVAGLLLVALGVYAGVAFLCICGGCWYYRSFPEAKLHISFKVGKVRPAPPTGTFWDLNGGVLHLPATGGAEP